MYLGKKQRGVKRHLKKDGHTAECFTHPRRRFLAFIPQARAPQNVQRCLKNEGEEMFVCNFRRIPAGTNQMQRQKQSNIVKGASEVSCSRRVRAGEHQLGGRLRRTTVNYMIYKTPYKLKNKKKNHTTAQKERQREDTKRTARLEIYNARRKRAEARRPRLAS